jgi:hypothetical protein
MESEFDSWLDLYHSVHSKVQISDGILLIRDVNTNKGIKRGRERQMPEEYLKLFVWVIKCNVIEVIRLKK